MTLELSGKQLGPYKVESLIGRGGMAAVYQAFHPATDRQVAIKVMLPDVATDEVFQRRFEREAKTLAGLQHIHILSVFDYGEQDGVNYLVMPYLPGRTLGDRLEETQMSLADVAATFRQLASALDYAHGRGILHRDLKPDNIMLDASGNALLADFGLTRLLDEARRTDKLTSDSTVIGTPAYMSPEQGQGLELDHRSDLYSLTVVLYEMLTGSVPYQAETPVAVIFKHIQDDLPPLSDIRDDLPPTVEQVLQKGMAKLPEYRYDSATEIADAFEQAIADKAIADPARRVDTVTLPTPKRKRADGELTTTQAASLPPVDDLEHAATTAIDSGEIKPKRGEASRASLINVVAGIMTAVIVVAGIIIIPMRAVEFGAGADFTTVQRVFPAHDETILDIAVSADGTQLITGSTDNTARVWNLESDEMIYELEGHSSDVTHVGIRPDGALYLTSEQAEQDYTWIAATGIRDTVNLGGANVGTAFTRDGALEMGVGRAAMFVVYSRTSAERQERQARFFVDNTIYPEALFDIAASVPNPNTPSTQFTAVDVSPIVTPDGETDDGRERFRYTVVTGDSEGNLIVWHVRRDTAFESVEEIEAAAYGSEQMYRYITVEQAAETNQNRAEGITAIAFAADGQTFAAADEQGDVFVWELASLNTLLNLPDENGAVNDMVYSPDGRLLVAATEEVAVLVYDLESETVIAELFTDAGDPTALAFTPDGRLLAGADDGSVYIWDLSPETMTAGQ